MNRGFTLIEVLVALILCMIIFLGAMRLSIFTIRSGSYAEALTFASVYGHTKLASLVNEPYTAADLQPRWHQDPANPTSHDGFIFYRFWKVDEVETGKKVVLYIAWDSSAGERAADFGSEDDLKGSRCSKISFSDMLFKD
jgi:prepilin-type N-terminal cleavage/methylation domain-containing protein